MYTLIPKTDLPEYNNIFKFQSLDEFYNENTKTYPVPEFPNANIFDHLNYGTVVFKPVKDDFIIIYNNDFAWGKKVIKDPSVLIGKSLNEAFPIFDKIKISKIFKHAYDNHESLNVDYELYWDKQLVFINNSYCFRQDDLLYVFTINNTLQTLNKQKMLRLTEDIEAIQGFSKIFFVTYEDGKFIYSKEVYNILGIKPEDYDDNVDLVGEFSSPEDKEEFKQVIRELTPENNTYSRVNKITDAKGNVKFLNLNLVADFDEKGKITIVHKFFQDITEETLAKESAMDLQRNMDIIGRNSKIAICSYKNGKNNWTNGIYNILEIRPEDYPSDIDLIEEFVVPEEKGLFYKHLKELTPENPILNTFRTVKLVNGDIHIIETRVEAFFNKDGVLTSFVTFFLDATENILRERNLEQLSEDRKILLQEVHHRVKNNLQLILSFLSLESRYNRDNPEYVIEQTQNRIRTMALTHEEVYQSSSVSKVNLQSFIIKGVTNLFNLYSHNKISLHFDIEPVEVDIDKSIPLSLLVNEVCLNTIKYAFPNENKGDFCINLKKSDDMMILKVWDNGVGLPDNVDFSTSDTLGFIIIRNLTQQLEANLTVLEDVSGFGIKLIIPL